jgi:hypothetical protein
VIVLALVIIFAQYLPRLKPMAAGQSQNLNPWDTAATAHTIPSQESNGAASTIPTANTKTENASVDDLVKPLSAPSGVDKSVVGQAFQVSDAVKERCKRDTIECPVVMESLARMVKEPRDMYWAAKMEEEIQAVVDGQGSGKFVVRNLECRTSICILEVEVHDPGSLVPRYDNAIVSNLKPNGLVIAETELDASGAHFNTELLDFYRK